MTPSDRPCGPSGRREVAGRCRGIVKTARRPPAGRRADRNGGSAQGFRTALRVARDALLSDHGHRHAPRALPKTLGQAVPMGHYHHESLSPLLGIRRDHNAIATWVGLDAMCGGIPCE